jgi:hypothetical protein
MTNARKRLAGNLKGKRQLGKPCHTCEDAIKIDLRETGFEIVGWIHLA